MFLLNEEQTMLLSSLQRFLNKEYPLERVKEIDDSDCYPRELVQKLAKLDLMGLTIPTEYGGVGRDLIAACLVCEELAKRSIALAWVYVEAVFFGGENIRHLGTEGQKKKYLPGIVNGEIIFSYALTEPNVGSDTASVQTFARPEGDGFRLNGSKMFISGASASDYMLVLARTDRNVPKHKGLTFFIIDAHAPGVSTKSIKKIGIHGSDTCEVVLDDVFVPLENVLGGLEKVNQGWGQLLSTLDVEHAHLAAESVGLAQGALELAIKYSKERKQFGQTINNFQAIQHTLAELATQIEAARLMTYNVATLAQDGKSCWKEGAMAKWYSAEVARNVAIRCMEIFGGYGYADEYEISRIVRDSLILPIGGGTPQAQKNIIAKALGL